MPQHPVDLRVAAPALLVRQPAPVAGAGQHQPVPDPLDPFRVAGQPGDRPDGAGREDEPVGVVGSVLRQCPRQEHRHRDARQVVVGQRRVADVAGDDHLVGDLPGDDVLGVGEVAVRERGVDAHLVVALGQPVQGLLGQAEPPVGRVVAGAVRHPGGVVRQGVQVSAQLGQRHGRRHRHAVAEHVQAGRGEVDDPAAGGVGDVRVPDVPLLRHRPVEHLRPGRYLVHLQRNVLADDLQGGAHAVAGDAPAQRVQPLHQRVHLLADRGHRRHRRVSSTAPASVAARSTASRVKRRSKASRVSPNSR